LGEIRAMSYNSLEEVDTHSPTFLKLLKVDEHMDFGDLRIIRNAAFTMLHLIFIVTNMRYKFQQELLLAVDRLLNFLKCNEFGKSNPKSKLQNRLCMYYTFREIERFRQEITFFRTRNCDSLVINLCRKIPNLEQGSYISKIHVQLYHNDLGNSANLLIAGMDNSAAEPTNPLKPKPDKKDKGKGNIKPTPTDPKSLNGSPPTDRPAAAGIQNPPGNPAIKTQRFCGRFNSTVGCSTPKCRFKHETPSKGSPGWKILANYFATTDAVPTSAFLAGSS